MLLFVDVAVLTGKIAAGKYVKKDVALFYLESDGSGG
jgi:hypothetical protein